MATRKTNQRFKSDNPNFPICFENDSLQVYTNQNGEVFVENKIAEDGQTLRITRAGTGMVIRPIKAYMAPHAVQGMKRINVSSEKKQ
jgi:hypothetical protein